MVERQQVDQRPELQPARALRQCREDYARRGREAERRAVMFGDVVTMKTAAVVHLAEPQPPFQMLGERQAAVVHMVENPELHRRLSRSAFQVA